MQSVCMNETNFGEVMVFANNSFIAIILCVGRYF